MKILCLHGAYGSASNFKVQLGPFIDAIERFSSVEFIWINGGHLADPPPGFDTYFGIPPLYRFIEFDGVSELDDMLSKLRDLPSGNTAEDTMRRVVGDKQTFSCVAVKSTLDRLFKFLDEDPEIEGILGYSEGATVASTLILEESRRWKDEGRPRRIKYGLFFAGWPPVRLQNDHVQCLLADECDDIIDIPTCHVVGCSDPYIHGAMALLSMCCEETATIFDHGKGHTVPRDARTVEELARAVPMEPAGTSASNIALAVLKGILAAHAIRLEDMRKNIFWGGGLLFEVECHNEPRRWTLSWAIHET